VSCWEWLGGLSTQGYGTMGCSNGLKGQLAHRVSWALFRGPLTSGKCVQSTCGSKTCVNPDHLRLASDQGDAVRWALNKLTDEQVREIRACPEAGATAIARQYGVSQPCISNILLGKTRKDA